MDVCVPMYLFLESMLFLERMFSRVVPLSSCTFIAVAVVVYQIDILVEENGKNVKISAPSTRASSLYLPVEILGAEGHRRRGISHGRLVFRRVIIDSGGIANVLIFHPNGPPTPPKYCS